jgi:tRNA uridine 5-carbamoylmethylation protein Kti12
VLTILPFGIVGSGKSTFLKTLTQIVKKLDWSISSISSDALRKELVDKYREKFTDIAEKEAFDKTAKSAGAEFNRRLEKLINDAGKAAHKPVHVIFIDKNHPPNAIDRTVKTINEKLPQGCKGKILYLIPKI